MRFDRGVPIKVFFAPPEVSGRFFYRSSMEGFNFDVVDTRVEYLLSTLLAVAQNPPGERQGVYLGSTPTPALLPGFERENPLPLALPASPEPRIWIGNQSIVAPHFDESDNIACVVRGRRKFRLFPPDQLSNLYVGPIDQTMAGQPASMVDIDNPDFDRFPRFRHALETMITAELDPGDAIYIPALWWHHVEARGDLNVLINYWWNDVPLDGGSPMNALGHGLMTISHLPPEQREVWRRMFDHYVFRTEGDPAAHIPPAAQGILGPSTPQLRQRMKAFLLKVLSH